MRKRAPKTYINVVEDLYEGSSTSIESMCEETEDFRVRVGVHQGFALNPYLFFVVMDEVTKEIHGGYHSA